MAVSEAPETPVSRKRMRFTVPPARTYSGSRGYGSEEIQGHSESDGANGERQDEVDEQGQEESQSDQETSESDVDGENGEQGEHERQIDQGLSESDNHEEVRQDKEDEQERQTDQESSESDDEDEEQDEEDNQAEQERQMDQESSESDGEDEEQNEMDEQVEQERQTDRESSESDSEDEEQDEVDELERQLDREFSESDGEDEEQNIEEELREEESQNNQASIDAAGGGEEEQEEDISDRGHVQKSFSLSALATSPYKRTAITSMTLDEEDNQAEQERQMDQESSESDGEDEEQNEMDEQVEQERQMDHESSESDSEDEEQDEVDELVELERQLDRELSESDGEDEEQNIEEELREEESQNNQASIDAAGGGQEEHEEDVSDRGHVQKSFSLPALATSPYKRTAIMNMTLDEDMLDCGVCCLPLKPPIFQCDVGHVVCSSCRNKLADVGRCHVCRTSITGGYRRCHALEQLVESIRGSCPNATYGCAARVPYYDLDAHLVECPHAPCHCPAEACGFVGSTAGLLHHFDDTHKWPCITGVRNSETLVTHLHDGFNFMSVIHEAGEHLFLLRVVRSPFGRAISSLCIHPQATRDDSSLSPSQNVSCRLKLFYLRGVFNKSGMLSHLQDSNFKVACTDLSNGMPDLRDCFQFIVPNDVQPETEATVKVEASFTIR